MSRIICGLLLSLFTTLSGHFGFSQDRVVGSVPYQEKVYVQLNQELFLSGDTLWAGVVVLESTTFAPSQLSKVAYLEIWAEGSAVVKRRVRLKQSSSMVAVELPADLPSGMYMVRAYTRWMRNGPEELFFKHWIRVVNPQSPPPVKEAGQELFPLSVELALEGGQIIAGQPQVLHIRTTSWDATAVPTQGFLIAGADTIQEIQMNERGYTRLSFVADPATSYQLSVKTSQEGYETIFVGKSISMGIGMRLIQEDEDAYLQLVGGEGKMRYEATVGIMAHGKLQKLPVISFRSDEGRRIRLNELSLGNGVAQFILWDENEEYVGSCFWAGKKGLPSKTNPSEGREEINILTTRSIGRNPIGILEYSNTFSGLPHFVPSHHGQLENLEEWLPFEGNHESQSASFTTQEAGGSLLAAECDGIVLEGSVRDGEGNPVANETVFLAFPGDIAWIHLAATDSNGLFHFVLEPEIGQPVSTIIRGSKAFGPNWELSLNSGFADNLRYDAWPSLTLDSVTWNQLQHYYQNQQLARQYLDSETSMSAPQGITLSTSIYGKPDYVYRFADYTTMPTEEAFIEFLSQAYIRKPNKVKTIYLLNSERQELFPGPPLLMIDGVPVVNSAEIFRVNYRLVDRIELVTHPFVLNGKYINGILNLVTFQKDASSVVLREGELRAELLIVPPASSVGNMILTGDHVPDFGRINEIRLERSTNSFERVLPATVWVQSVSR